MSITRNPVLKTGVGVPMSTPPTISRINANVPNVTYLLCAVKLSDLDKKISSISVGALLTTNDDINILLIKNPTIANEPAYTDFLDENSNPLGAQYIQGNFVTNPSITTITGGQQIWSAPIGRFTRTIDNKEVNIGSLTGVTGGAADVFALAARPTPDGTNSDVYGLINLILE